MNCKDFEKEFGNYSIRNRLLTCKGKLHNQHDIKMKSMLQKKRLQEWNCIKTYK